MTRLSEINGLFNKHYDWKRQNKIVCMYHGAAHVLLGVALPDLLLLTPLTLEHAELLKPVERVTEADPEFESVYTQLKADFQNQFGAE